MGECKASAGPPAGVWRLHCSWQLFIFLSGQVFGKTIAELLEWQNIIGRLLLGIAATAVTMAGALKTPRC